MKRLLAVLLVVLFVLGCLAAYAAERYGIEVTGITVSREQVKLARKRCKGLPVTIRLLDPPLHEFLPNQPEQFKALTKQMKLRPGQLEEKAEQLHESNPMLGHRGCRLGITFPAIYAMQARAICEAAGRPAARGPRPAPNRLPQAQAAPVGSSATRSRSRWATARVRPSTAPVPQGMPAKRAGVGVTRPTR